MTLNYNVTGAKRKELVSLIANFSGCEAHYKGAPSFAYEVDYFTIDRNGAVSFDDRADSEVIERLIEMLYDNSFIAEPAEEQYTDTEPTGLTISVPLDKVKVGNLTNILESKADLIKKALGVSNIRITVDTDMVNFPWFDELPDADTANAYSTFICKLCEMSVNQTRITAKEKTVDNEKYAFRCFLLRLGFIGEEYKAARKILLRNLSGSSAFKSGAKKEASDDVSE